MLRPSYDEVLRKINEGKEEKDFDSKYSVVIAVAKRAREIAVENETSSEKIVKPVTKSIKEILTNKVHVDREHVEETCEDCKKAEEDK